MRTCHSRRIPDNEFSSNVGRVCDRQAAQSDTGGPRTVDVSFVILAWNSARLLNQCLLSIDRNLADSALSYEVLVLDNGSTDGTDRLLAQNARQSNGRVIPYYEATNTGTTRSRNRMFAEARGSYVCVMDSDVELSRGVLEGLIGYLDQDSGVGIVVPRLVYPSGAWQKSFDRFPTCIDKINRLFRLREIERREALKQPDDGAPFLVDYAISAFWLMRREVLQRVGLLDERIFYAPEDVDYCLRVWKTGLQIVCVPSVSLVHHTQEISRGWKLNRAKLSHVKGLGYYFFKHRYFLRRPQFAGPSVTIENRSLIES